MAGKIIGTIFLTLIWLAVTANVLLFVIYTVKNKEVFDTKLLKAIRVTAIILAFALLTLITAELIVFTIQFYI